MGRDPLEADRPFHRSGIPDTLYSRYLHYDSQQRQNYNEVALNIIFWLGEVTTTCRAI